MSPGEADDTPVQPAPVPAPPAGNEPAQAEQAPRFPTFVDETKSGFPPMVRDVESIDRDRS